MSTVHLLYLAGHLDTFTLAYIEAALWSSTDESNEQGGNPLDDNYTIADIHPDTLVRMVSDCDRFQAGNAEAIVSDLGMAGHDFWLTRNHHGCGYWDGDWPEDGDRLTTASHTFGEFHLYVGDDGQIHGYPL